MAPASEARKRGLNQDTVIGTCPGFCEAMVRGSYVGVEFSIFPPENCFEISVDAPLFVVETSTLFFVFFFSSVFFLFQFKIGCTRDTRSFDSKEIRGTAASFVR